jgi:hypothetical protein
MTWLDPFVRRLGIPSLLLCALVAAAPVSAQDEEEEDTPTGPPVLFDSHDVIELTMEADFRGLKGDRSQEEEERPGIVRVRNGDGTEVELEIQVRTRGNFRLRRGTCEFPPLRLNFKKRQVEGTVFQGQDRIKLVDHCRDRDDYEQRVIKEYLIYRMYGLFTDVSFQVRPARITYVDTSGGDEPVTRFAFFLEHEDNLGERLGGMMLDVPQVSPDAYDGHFATRLAVFQFMIGNTDWSMVQFHNVNLIRHADGRHLPVPYDMDWSGLVNAPYARPDASLGIRRVTDRVYRGFCRPDVDFPAIYQEFVQRRDAIFGLLNETGLLAPDVRADAAKYLDQFFEVIGSERRARREIESACRAAN